MCLAYDIGCHVYYQDTDSIHIEYNDLPKLEYGFQMITSCNSMKIFLSHHY